MQQVFKVKEQNFWMGRQLVPDITILQEKYFYYLILLSIEILHQEYNDFQQINTTPFFNLILINKQARIIINNQIINFKNEIQDIIAYIIHDI